MRCEAWFGFCRRKMLDPVKFTEGLLQSMANMLWTWPVSENGAQYVGMGEQMFMTLRVQGDPLSSQTHWSKRWTASFERTDISQLAKCTNNVQKCLVQLCMKLSPNICNTAKFVHVGPGGLLVRGGNKYESTGVTVRQVPQCPRWLCGEVGEGVW